MHLRPYQVAALEAVENRFREGDRSTLLCLPTGTGKTIVFAALAARVVRKGGRCLVLAHRAELLTQTIDKIRKITGIKAGLEKASSAATAGRDCIPYTVVVGSVQSMCSEKRLRRFSPDEFSLVIIDECHHSMAPTYGRVVSFFSGARLLGTTATPDRGDGQGLEKAFDSIAYDYSIVQAIRDGYLVKVRAQTIPLKLDLTAVQKHGGDYAAGGVGSALEPYLAEIAARMGEICKSRKTVVFTPLIATSRHLQPFLEQAGLAVREVNGESIDRLEAINWFAGAPAGAVLLNSMLLTEGWDCPSVDCVVVLRATKVRSLYVQMVGRGTRLSPGKDNLLLLDFLWLTAAHDLCRPATLIGVNDHQTAEHLAEHAEKEGGIDLDDAAIEAAKDDTVKDRENALAQKLADLSRHRGRLVDPMEFAAKVEALPDEEEPSAARCTIDQLNELEKIGIAAPKSKEAAEKLITVCRDRENQGLTTPKQIRLLSSKGFHHVEKWSRASARNMISRLAMQGWRRLPPGVNPETYQP